MGVYKGRVVSRKRMSVAWYGYSVAVCMHTYLLYRAGLLQLKLLIGLNLFLCLKPIPSFKCTSCPCNCRVQC